MNACLGIRSLNQTGLVQERVGPAGCRKSHVLEEEKSPGDAVGKFFQRKTSCRAFSEADKPTGRQWMFHFPIYAFNVPVEWMFNVEWCLLKLLNCIESYGAHYPLILPRLSTRVVSYIELCFI